MSTTVVNLQKAGTGRCVKLRVTGLGGRDYAWELLGSTSKEEGTIKGVPEHMTFEELVGEILYRTGQERKKLFENKPMIGGRANPGGYGYGTAVGYNGVGGFYYGAGQLRDRIQVLENENKVLKETRIPSSDMGWYNAEFQRLKSERDRLQLELDGAIRARDNYRKALEAKEPVTLTGIRGEAQMLSTATEQGFAVCPDCGEVGHSLYRVNTPYQGSAYPISSVTECQCGATFIFDDSVL